MATGTDDLLLTFDDGPDPIWTPRILDLLEKYNQQAMFFILGKQINGNEHIIQRMLNKGHIIGSHGMNHFPLIFNMDSLFEREIQSVHSRIKDRFDYTIRYFRPPWGIINRKLRKRCEDSLGYEFVFWNKDSLDYIWPFRKSLTLNHREKNIILMHDGHAYSPLKSRKHTIRMLEALLITISG